jgi:hypothetical protein
MADTEPGQMAEVNFGRLGLALTDDQFILLVSQSVIWFSKASIFMCKTGSRGGT